MLVDKNGTPKGNHHKVTHLTGLKNVRFARVLFSGGNDPFVNQCTYSLRYDQLEGRYSNEILKIKKCLLSPDILCGCDYLFVRYIVLILQRLYVQYKRIYLIIYQRIY